MRDKLLVSFFGSSGSGKSTCYKYAKKYLTVKGYSVFRVNVAKPLKLIQAYSYKLFNKGYSGDPSYENFKQDGQLLGFLAKHFENQLGNAVEKEIKKCLRIDGKVALINTDCRNNAYETLKKLGFIFVKIDVHSDVLANRRLNRGDITTFNYDADVEKCNKISSHYSICNDTTFEDLEKNIFSFLEEVRIKRSFKK